MSLHEGHRRRMADRFLTQGLEGFTQHQALELLLFFAVPRCDTNLLAHTIIDNFGSLGNAMDAPLDELIKIPGVGRHTATLIKLIPQMARQYELSKEQDVIVLSDREQAGKYCVKLLTGYARETFYLICLNSDNRVLAAERLSTGTVTETMVSERIVAERVFKHGASRVILTHNHPAGLLMPSPADRAMTRRIVTLLGLLGVEVLDHIIVGRGKFVAMSDQDF